MKTPQFLLASLALLSVSAYAAPITYTSTYWPYDLPSTSGGTAVNPSWGLVQTAGSATASGGYLTGDTMPNASAQQYWILGDNGSTTFGNAEAWNMDSSVGGTVDFALSINASTAAPGTSPQILGGFGIFVSDGTYWAGVFFDTTQISLWGSGVHFVSERDNTLLQTYRIAFDNGIISLYEAGSDSAIFDMEDMNTGAAGNNTLYFGDAASGSSGSFNLAFIGWNNGLAEYTAPDPVTPIPEPSSMILLGLAAAAYLGVRKSKS